MQGNPPLQHHPHHWDAQRQQHQQYQYQYPQQQLGASGGFAASSQERLQPPPPLHILAVEAPGALQRSSSFPEVSKTRGESQQTQKPRSGLVSDLT